MDTAGTVSLNWQGRKTQVSLLYLPTHNKSTELVPYIHCVHWLFSVQSNMVDHNDPWLNTRKLTYGMMKELLTEFGDRIDSRLDKLESAIWGKSTSIVYRNESEITPYPTDYMEEIERKAKEIEMLDQAQKKTDEELYKINPNLLLPLDTVPVKEEKALEKGQGNIRAWTDGCLSEGYDAVNKQYQADLPSIRKLQEKYSKVSQPIAPIGPIRKALRDVRDGKREPGSLFDSGESSDESATCHAEEDKEWGIELGHGVSSGEEDHGL
jgi:hypothetical protein